MSILDVSGVVATNRRTAPPRSRGYAGRARRRGRPLPYHLSPSPAFPPPGHGIVVLGLVLGDLLVGQRHVEKLVGHPADVLVYDRLGSPHRVVRLGPQTTG